MSTPITQAALDTFKRRVVFKGSTESDLVEGVTDLVASMARLERAHATERARLDWLEGNAGDIPRYNSRSWIWIAHQNLREKIDAAMKEETK